LLSLFDNKKKVFSTLKLLNSPLVGFSDAGKSLFAEQKVTYRFQNLSDIHSRYIGHGGAGRGGGGGAPASSRNFQCLLHWPSHPGRFVYN